MRLLVFGHWSHTGFGVVTEHLATRFLAAGHDVRVIAVNHRGEPITGPLTGRVWPAALYGEPFGGNWSHEAIDGTVWPKLDPADDWKPDQVLVVSDPSGLMGHIGQRGLLDPRWQQWASLPVWHYCPIEGDRLSVGWRTLWQHIQPVAMSHYGARQISEHIGRVVPMVYHGVDTDIFRPVRVNDPLRFGDRTFTSKRACREAFGIDPEAHVILRTDRNVTRKFYPTLFEAFDAIAAADRRALLVVHCRPIDPEGPNLVDELARMSETGRNRIVFTNQHDTFKGLPTAGLVALMNAADVYVSTTGGEGFGLTLAEAAACEVPVVATDWAADAETVGPGGFLVPPLIDRYGEAVRYHSVYGMDWALPDPRGFVEPVLTLLGSEAKRARYGEAGRAHVVANFNWDTAAADFLRLFEDAHV
jgi:glycosyltransferase involved in cell wall biosynthesis